MLRRPHTHDTYAPTDEQPRNYDSDSSLSISLELTRIDSHSSDLDSTAKQTVNRKVADVCPGSVRVREQVTVHGIAPTWEGGR